jgi:hypothetical protein
MFIRSFSQGMGGGQFYGQFHTQSGRSLQLICPIVDVVKAFSEGRLQGYWEVILMSHQ